MPRPPILCYVTDRHLLPKLDAQDVRENLLDKIAAAASAGVDWIQLREKDLSGRDCGTLALQALQRIANSTSKHAAPARLLVNDRLDVALAERAGGVHLGERSLPLAEAKRLTDSLANRKNFLIGVSCHSLDAARSAELDGADYIFFGPVFPTPSKAAYGAPQGLPSLAKVCARLSIPVIAIGGITQENAAGCLRAGATGLAAIRLFQQAPDLSSLVLALRALPS